jgi:hypothetical protein
VVWATAVLTFIIDGAYEIFDFHRPEKIWENESSEEEDRGRGREEGEGRGRVVEEGKRAEV